MLDLTTMTSANKLYEIKMLDGEVLTLRLPTQRLLMELINMKDFNTTDPLEAIKKIAEMTAMILNQNTQGKEYTAESVAADLDLAMMNAIITDYFKSTTSKLGE